jgi:signal peptidase I
MDIYYIPSNSMENTLLKDDVIIVNKLVYGPLFPKLFTIKWSTPSTGIKGKTSDRFSGYSEIKQGHLFVYQDPTRGFFVVKRCVGVAGDTLVLKNKEIYTNQKHYTSLSNIKHTYLITGINARQLSIL